MILKKVLFVLLLSVCSLAQEGAYVDDMSVAHGDTLKFYISTSYSSFSMKVYRTDVDNTFKYLTTYTNIRGGIQTVPASSYMDGCNWNITYKLVVPTSWIPGVYRATFPSSEGTKGVLFIVRPKTKASYSNILVIAATNTWQAYNTFGGNSLYPSNAPSRSKKVSFHRPSDNAYGNYLFTKWESRFLSYNIKNSIETEYAADLDLHRDQSLLSSYKVVYIVGHNEYWTLEMRNQLEEYVSHGGKVIILGGNIMWWQARYEDNFKTLVCYKDRTLDPLDGVNNDKVTVNWHAAPVYNPENKITGLSYRNGGYVNNGSILPASAGYGDYIAMNTHHWVYDGTDLLDGSEFGTSSAIVGYEVDGALIRWSNGIPVPTGTDSSPLDLRILGLSPASTGSSTTNRNSAIGYYSNANGGAVFNTGTINWAGGLASDPIVQRITKNVLNVFLNDKLPPDITSYSPRTTSSATINNMSVQINSRKVNVKTGSSYTFSVTASDPYEKTLRYVFKRNGDVVDDDNSYSWTVGSGTPITSTITAYVINSKDTATISWEAELEGATTEPAIPVLAYPANGATGIPLTLTFRWLEAANASRYQLQVSPGSDFSILTYNSDQITDTFKTITLPTSDIYFWRVRGFNTATGTYSAIFNFRNDTPADTKPATPILLSPVKGATNVSTPITLIWSKVPGATRYQVQVSTSYNYPTTTYNNSNVVDTFVTVNIPTAGLYYWRVRAFNTLTGNYTSSFNFRTDGSTTTTLGTPTLSYPSNGATSIPLTLTFKWFNVKDANRYQLQVSTYSNFSVLIYSSDQIADSFKTITLTEGTYYWRVRAFNASETGSYSSVFSFTAGSTSTATPGRPVLISPSNGVTGVPLVLTFKWTKAENATRYQIQVSKDYNYPTVVYNNEEITDTVHTITISSPGLYYWRVRAWNGNIKGSYTSSFRFTTVSSSPNSIANYITLDKGNEAAATLGNPIRLRWSTLVDEDEYKFFIEKTKSANISWTKIQNLVLSRNENNEFSFTDNDLAVGKYKYRVGMVMHTGAIIYSNEIEKEVLPVQYELHQNYPNPFNASTTISFDIPEESNVVLTLYSIIGEKITELVNGRLEQGNYKVTLNMEEHKLSGGVYLYYLEANDFVYTKKLIYMK